MKKLLFFLLITSFLACKKEVKNKNKEALIMYESSEMANLMNKMFEENANLKKQIEKGEKLGNFNSDFLKIHTATLTDPSDRNNTFNAFATAFIQNQKDVYSVNETHTKKQFNRMVQNCIACHETNCTGPIPRIKKLFIK